MPEREDYSVSPTKDGKWEVKAKDKEEPIAVFDTKENAESHVGEYVEITLVKKALESDKYLWRTIDGVVRETKLPKEEVLHVLKDIEAEVIQSDVPSIDGQTLFTTRRHFQQKAAFRDRLSKSLTFKY